MKKLLLALAILTTLISCRQESRKKPFTVISVEPATLGDNYEQYYLIDSAGTEFSSYDSIGTYQVGHVIS